MKASPASTQPPRSRVITKDSPLKHNHKYLIIFRTTKGRYINFSCGHDGIDWAVHNAYEQIELMLTEVMQDTISWILVLSRLHNDINSPTIQNMLNNGINPLNHACLQSVLETAICKPLAMADRRKAHNTKQISDITHLTHYTHDNKYQYDLNYDDNLTTAQTLQGNYFTFASECINLYSLDCVFNQIKELRRENKLPNRRLDPIVKLFISHKSNAKHFDIVVNHLKEKPLQVNFDLVPSHCKIKDDFKVFSPCRATKQANNQLPSTAQAGKTNFQQLIFLLVMCIFCLPFVNAIAYTDVLSNNYVSGLPSREPLAFFVSKKCLTTQIKQTQDTKSIIKLLQQDNSTLTTKTDRLSISYEGATLQNKKAFGQICKAVSNVTESEPPHPINTFYSVNLLTQKLTLGGLSNA